ncbi:MAG: Zn-dependent alcohol dehydrogenase [uncultured archaeon A07HB70]|jgi:Zn-dependent alcohol dehydrogenases|nr:MAG: Zn-dependent alcohol dehydrogenase [uncultured archaeon A07HB70]
MLAARLHERAESTDRALSPDETDRPTLDRSDGVLVEVEGAGWCQTNNQTVEGTWTDCPEQSLPMTLGNENAGAVVDPSSADVASGVGAQQVPDFVGADQTTGLAPDVVAGGGNRHVVGYGGHVHGPPQALVNGEIAGRAALVPP